MVRKLSIGSINWIQELSQMSDSDAYNCNKLQREGKSVMALLQGRTYSGLIAVADPIREKSKKVLQKLKEMV